MQFKSLPIVAGAFALAIASFSMGAAAQTTMRDTNGSGGTSAAPARTGTGPVERAENATKRGYRATKRGVKKAGAATSRAGSRAAGAVRNTGDKISAKLPPAPRDQGLNGQGQPVTPKN